MPISDREWRAMAPQIAQMLRGAAAAEREGTDYAEIPALQWAGPPTSGPMTANEIRASRAGLLEPGDYHPIPAGVWDKRP